LPAAFADWSPVFSPDGRWLAYNSNESGADEVYVRAFTAPATGQGAKVQISNRGGINPVWSRSGRELLYLSGDQIMTSSYTVSGESFVAEKPRVWAANLGRPVTFDLAPDGKPRDSASAGGNTRQLEERSPRRLLAELLRRVASSRARRSVSIDPSSIP
jgi:WD40-like Beta Propeller Repeat